MFPRSNKYKITRSPLILQLEENKITERNISYVQKNDYIHSRFSRFKNKRTAKAIVHHEKSSQDGIQQTTKMLADVNPIHQAWSFIYSMLPRNTIPESDPRSGIGVLFARYRKREVNLMISLVHVP